MVFFEKYSINNSKLVQYEAIIKIFVTTLKFEVSNENPIFILSDGFDEMEYENQLDENEGSH